MIFVTRAKAMGPSERREMIRKENNKLSLTRQCKLLKINRSSICYTPLTRQRLIYCMRSTGYLQVSVPWQPPDCSLSSPIRVLGWASSRSSSDEHHGVPGDLQRAKHQQETPTTPHLSTPAERLAITRPNQVWCSDIAYIPVKRGFLYLVAIMGWATRKVLTWRLSNTLDASFCVEALEEAIARYGKPEIMNTDQGSQYTGAGWITTLAKANIKISMDGRGRYLGNIFIERLWRSLKQEAVYLHEITDGFQAKRIIDNGSGFYNSERPHTALDKQTPNTAYFGQAERRKAA
ncbi:MAG: IS3 family transposase [Robiginitomaculum sp.]|nr:MAG: IS3 family transposase [Robiginitomaculum sp.]